MNFGEIKAFLGNKPEQSINTGLQKQLREEGLRQAAQGVQVNTQRSMTFSSQTTVGLRVYNNALNENVNVDGKQAKLPNPDEKQKSLFDFEEIAKNVLRFVGGVITSAARSGADEAKLTSLFDQARSGVAKGIKMAEKDLQGLMNDDISKGISASADLIEQGIQRLQEKLFGSEQQDQQSQSSAVVSQQVSASQAASGELSIRTRDGDRVVIRFEDLQQFELNRRQFIEQGQNEPAAAKSKDVQHNDVLPREQSDDVPLQPQTDSNSAAQHQPVESQTTKDNTQQQSNRPANEEPLVGSQVQHAIFVAKESLSFSVSGELDDAELQAIGELVADTNDLANEFFEGDIDKAFNQALQLGFDEHELTGFALQLTRQEQVQVVNTYETVSLYDEKPQRSANPAKAVEPISRYLDKMLNVFEQSQQKLADGSEYENLVNGLINRLQEIDTGDLVSAINRFHTFNKQLLSNLPSQTQEA